jgi:hypothetical protein
MLEPAPPLLVILPALPALELSTGPVLGALPVQLDAPSTSAVSRVVRAFTSRLWRGGGIPF